MCVFINLSVSILVCFLNRSFLNTLVYNNMFVPSLKMSWCSYNLLSDELCNFYLLLKAKLVILKKIENILEM